MSPSLGSQALCNEQAGSGFRRGNGPLAARGRGPHSRFCMGMRIKWVSQVPFGCKQDANGAQGDCTMGKKWIGWAVVAAAVTGLTADIAAAQTYPVRPIRVVVGFSPGGPADVMARLLGQRMA